MLAPACVPCGCELSDSGAQQCITGFGSESNSLTGASFLQAEAETGSTDDVRKRRISAELDGQWWLIECLFCLCGFCEIPHNNP